MSSDILRSLGNCQPSFGFFNIKKQDLTPARCYFPLVVSSAIMIEPTETESKEEIDLFIEAIKSIVREAEESPEKLKAAPTRSKVRRLDETHAARYPCLTG